MTTSLPTCCSRQSARCHTRSHWPGSSAARALLTGTPEGARRYNASAGTAQTRRDFDQVTRFLDGLEIVGPGVVQCHRWRPGRG
jgi:S-adenosyl methyltransferase